MSDELKWELAQELGLTDVVSTEGWGGVSARNCGNLVKLAIMRAEESMARDYAAGRRLEPAGRSYGGTGRFPVGSRIGGPEAVPYWAVSERESEGLRHRV